MKKLLLIPALAISLSGCASLGLGGNDPCRAARNAVIDTTTIEALALAGGDQQVIRAATAARVAAQSYANAVCEPALEGLHR